MRASRREEWLVEPRKGQPEWCTLQVRQHQTEHWSLSCMDPPNQAASLKHWRNITGVYEKAERQTHREISCSVMLWNNTHTHMQQPLSKLKWGLQSNTLGFSAEDCSYRMGVAVLNESKCPNGKTVDPKWGITKRIWIPPTAHSEAGK